MPEKAKPPVQFISRIRAADIMCCSVQLLDKMIKRGELRAYRFGRKVLLRQDQLLALVEANEIR